MGNAIAWTLIIAVCIGLPLSTFVYNPRLESDEVDVDKDSPQVRGNAPAGMLRSDGRGELRKGASGSRTETSASNRSFWPHYFLERRVNIAQLFGGYVFGTGVALFTTGTNTILSVINIALGVALMAYGRIRAN